MQPYNPCISLDWSLNILILISDLGRVSPQSAAMGGLGNKPAVTCEICGKKLADPSSLYRHRKIHSGDKPHKCPYCTRRFIQRYIFQTRKTWFNTLNTWCLRYYLHHVIISICAFTDTTWNNISKPTAWKEWPKRKKPNTCPSIKAQLQR